MDAKLSLDKKIFLKLKILRFFFNFLEKTWWLPKELILVSISANQSWFSPLKSTTQIGWNLKLCAKI